MKILVIEDEPSNLKLAHHVLSAAGHDVTDAEAAEHVFSAIQHDQPDIIFLDLQLPGMDGLELTRRLKDDPATKHIPIVAVTAYPERWPRAEALKAGCSGYIIKPLNTRALPAQLSDAVVARQSKRDTHQ